jgi:hypothetical protein
MGFLRQESDLFLRIYINIKEDLTWNKEYLVGGDRLLKAQDQHEGASRRVGNTIEHSHGT